MKPRMPITAISDRRAALPADPAERRDAIDRARASLAAEERRLVRLALEPALTRCREERRYWEFVNAMFVIAEAEAGRPLDPEDAWPRAADR